MICSTWVRASFTPFYLAQPGIFLSSPLSLAPFAVPISYFVGAACWFLGLEFSIYQRCVAWIMLLNTRMCHVRIAVNCFVSLDQDDVTCNILKMYKFFRHVRTKSGSAPKILPWFYKLQITKPRLWFGHIDDINCSFHEIIDIQNFKHKCNSS